MARKRRAVFNPRKNRKQPKKDDTHSNMPSPEQWAAMPEYGKFVIRDEDGVDHHFKRGDTAMILPHGAKPNEPLEGWEYWVGKIKEIRANDPNDVWTRVQWYWAGPEVAQVLKSFNEGHCGEYERLYSDVYDYVSSAAFDAVVTVKKFDEHDIDQVNIDWNEFYTRRTFEYKARIIDPKPGQGTCLCNKPYSPDEIGTLMHFCPRPSCRQVYHQPCLLKENFIDPTAPSRAPRSSSSSSTAFLTERQIHLLSSSPDSDDPVFLQGLAAHDPADPSQEPLAKRLKSSPSGRSRVRAASKVKTRAKRKSIEVFGPSVQELLDMLPADLVRIAHQPIVRGAAYKAGGVTGNVRDVVRARRLVYQALAGTPLPDNWQDEVDVENAVVVLRGRKPIPPVICPRCKGAI